MVGGEGRGAISGVAGAQIAIGSEKKVHSSEALESFSAWRPAATCADELPAESTHSIQAARV
jgi:hypothetical protein